MLLLFSVCYISPRLWRHHPFHAESALVLSAGFRYIVVSEKRKLKGSFSSVISGVDPAFSRTASLHWAKMSITSDEVNFLVYRYLQESGLSHLHLIVNRPQFTLGRRDALYILKKKHVYEAV